MSDSKNIVLTGASGHLGSHLIRQLAASGFKAKGIDIADLPVTPLEWEFARADLTDFDQIREIFEGADVIVHCASIHPWKTYTDDQYLDANIKGTWHVYQAAAELGIDKVVLTSSISAVGFGNSGPDAWPATEEAIFPITDLYGITKHAQEDIARAFAGRNEVRTIALRPPAFMPHDPLRTGIGLTANFAVVQDIMSAHVAALEVILGVRTSPDPMGPFEAFTVTNELPYRREDLGLLGEGKNNRELVRKYWPEAYDWLVEQGFEGARLNTLFDLSKARRVLGWEPTYNFEQWLAENWK